MKNTQIATAGSMNRWRESARELRILRNLVFCGLMAAAAIVLSYVASIDIGPYLRIGFSDLPDRVIDCFFGPVTGAIFGGVLNIVKYFVKPAGDFNIFFTLNTMLADLIYGIFLYKKPCSMKNLLISGFIVKLFVNIINNTALLAIMYGVPVVSILPVRVLKNIIMWPIDAIIQFAVLTAVIKAFSKMKNE